MVAGSLPDWRRSGGDPSWAHIKKSESESESEHLALFSRTRSDTHTINLLTNLIGRMPEGNEHFHSVFLRTHSHTHTFHCARITPGFGWKRGVLYEIMNWKSLLLLENHPTNTDAIKMYSIMNILILYHCYPINNLDSWWNFISIWLSSIIFII